MTGFLTFGDDPVWEGRITCLGSDNRVASSPLGPDGSFRIVNPPLGRVRVGVSNYPSTTQTVALEDLEPLPGQANCVVPVRGLLAVPARYADPYHSGLSVEIEPGEQRVDIRLERQEGDPPFLRQQDLPTVGVEVGRIAPEVTGNDLQGRPLRLSEHRGKVVALLFWGHW